MVIIRASKNDFSHLINLIYGRFGNVENKTSATIRSELTSKNITDALGYAPLSQAFDKDGVLADTD